MARPTYILLGPPGAGKSTYSKRLADRTGFTRIGSGAIIRAFCASSKDKEEHKDICAKMEHDYAAGIPQSDEVTLMLIGQEIERDTDAKGFIFDAFPLSLNQAEQLEELRKKYDLAQPIVFFIQASEETVVSRIANRKVCRGCNSTYGPQDPGYDGIICPRCGSPLMRRVDDTPEIVRHRYHEYEERLAPVVEYYKSQGNFTIIDGEPTPDEVWSSVVEHLPVQ